MNTLATYLHTPQQPERPVVPIMDQEVPPIKILKILLPGKPTNTCAALSQRELEWMPPKLLNTLIHENGPEDLDDMGTVIRVKNEDEKFHEDIIRTVKWIKKGEAADIFISPELEVRKRKGDQKTTKFDPKIHADDDAYTTTQKTRTCFGEELDLYLFSINLEILELQRHMSTRLRSYPIYEHEVELFLKKLYANGSEAAEHVDQELAHFIADRIKFLHKTLIVDSSFIAALRACIPPRVQFQSLLYHDNVDNGTVEKALQVIEAAVGDADTAEALLRSFDKLHLNSSTGPPPSSPVLDRRSSNVSVNSNTNTNPASDALRLLDAVYQHKSLVRVEEHAVGTLVEAAGNVPQPFRFPNTDFRVARGQYLVLLPEKPRVYNGRACVVVNREGDIGELYGNYKLVDVQDIPPPPPPASPARSEGHKRIRQYSE